MSYPGYHSLVEKLAAKVISRVVQDGVALGYAITEAVKYADLDRQQTIHMCAVLQDYGMQYNGDQKNYFSYPDNDGLGKDVPVAEQGYVAYANAESRIKNGSMDKVFSTIAELRKKGFTDEEIVAFNAELDPIIAAINNVVGSYEEIVDKYENAGSEEGMVLFPQGRQDAMATEDQLAVAASAKRYRQSLEKWAQAADVEVESATKDNVAEALSGANAPAAAPAPDDALPAEAAGDEDLLGDLGAGVADDLGGEDLGGEEPAEAAGPVSAKVKPSPDELQTKIQDAPKWEIENILSIQSAENFYGNLRKELESVVFNENIVLDAASLKQYDGVRQKIDDEIQKIGDAQKETKKLEKKEGELEEEFEVGGDQDASAGPVEDFQVEGDAPTEDLLGGEQPLPAAPAV
jgi:hypothetical protein